ncbi:Death-associated protein kinase related-like [Oopsacas minuta]|uniref:Death-associated protein kinase related-like n=1 Tax=Oopsacas minuta TaxID=111878 RepID=A0AAV7JKG4_9METZ|nr:Death-associated protein kinase related-like [Oopsacas minuta]
MSINVEEIVKKEEIESYYVVGDVLGRGKFATVKHITEKATGNCYAAKYLRKRNYAVNCRNTILQEAELLQELLEHRVIVDVKEVFEGNLVMIIILELCTGGDLFHSISAEPFTERESVFVLKQVIDALTFLHKKSIIHLDIKPENILLINETKLDIKLADFGLAVKLSPIEEFKRIIGTPEYVAPEVINFEPLSTSSDMWSLGALTYALLCGYSPFLPEDDDSTDEEVSRLVEQADILSNVSQAKYDFDDEVFEGVSQNAKEFIRNLLVLNPKRRPDAEQCLRHQWLKTYNDITLDQRQSAHSPIQSSTSSGFSDMSDISTNLGSNMSADYKPPMRSLPATPEFPSEHNILEEKEPDITDLVKTQSDSMSEIIKQVDTSYKAEPKYETKIDDTKREFVENKGIESIVSQKIDKIVDMTDKKEKSSFTHVSSPKEERRESRYTHRLYSRKSPVESSEKSTQGDISEKQTDTATIDKDQRQQNDNTDGKRRNTKGMRRKTERSDTNIFFGVPGIPFKRSDYVAEGSPTHEVEQKNTSYDKQNHIPDESTSLESSSKAEKTPEKDVLSTTRNLAQESKIKRRTEYSRNTTGSPTSNKLEVPRTSKSTKHTNNSEQNYRTSNLIKYFNYKYNNGNNSLDESDTAGVTTSEPSTPVYKSNSPRTSKTLTLNESYTNSGSYSERMLHKQDPLQNYDTIRSPSPRLSRRSSTPNGEIKPFLGAHLASLESGYLSNMNSPTTGRSGLSRTQSYMELAKNESKSSDNIKSLLDKENSGGNKSRPTSPLPNHIYSPLSISSSTRKESYENIYARTMPRMKKNSSSSSEKERATVHDNPELFQSPTSCQSISESPVHETIAYTDSYPNYKDTEIMEITADAAHDLISASRRLRFYELDLQKVQTSIRAYDEHFKVDVRNTQFNNNNNSNRNYVNRQYSIPTSYIPMNSLENRYSRTSLSTRSINSSMEDIMEQSTTINYPAITLSDRFNIRKRVQSIDDEKPLIKRDSFMTRSTSLHSLRDEPYSPITKSSRYITPVNSPYQPRRTSKESIQSVQPYISVYKQNRSSHYKAKEFSY